MGEAPGRLGAGRTGVPFLGDVAGRRFERFLAYAGLQRENVFVTNAVLCLPLDGRGRNRRPRARELDECSGWLQDTLAAVDPDVVVAMGGVALEGLRRLEAHPLRVADAGSAPRPWHGRLLAVVYHPGARSRVHRPEAFQVADWAALRRWTGA